MHKPLRSLTKIMSTRPIIIPRPQIPTSSLRLPPNREISSLPLSHHSTSTSSRQDLEAAYLRSLLTQAGVPTSNSPINANSSASEQRSGEDGNNCTNTVNASRFLSLHLAFLLGFMAFPLIMITWATVNIVNKGDIAKFGELFRLWQRAKAEQLARATSNPASMTATSTTTGPLLSSDSADTKSSDAATATLDESGRETDIEAQNIELWNALHSAQTTLTQQWTQIAQLEEMAQRYESVALAQHRYLVELVINSSSTGEGDGSGKSNVNQGNKNPSVVLDDALLASRPIRLPDGQRLIPPNVALVRVLDATGRNRVILLAVDVPNSGPVASKTPATTKTQTPNTNTTSFQSWPRDSYNLHTYLLDLADHLQGLDRNSAQGVALYVVSNGVVVDVGKWYGSRATLLYDVRDVPAGWPVRQLRGIGNVMGKEGNVVNVDIGRGDEGE